MKAPKSLALSLAVTLLLVSASALPAQELTEETYATWRDHVLPEADELAFREIPWRTSFWEAVVEAQEQDRPILLWAMNGHPLCNT